MTQIPIALARRRAIMRLGLVLQKRFGDVLDLVAAAQGIGEQPHPEGYLATHPDTIEDYARDLHVGVWIWPDTDRQIQKKHTKVRNRVKRIATFRADIVCVFDMQYGAHEGMRDELGVPFEPDTYMRARAEAYTGALEETLLAYACNDDAIHDINVVGNLAIPVKPDKSTILGVSSVRAVITQVLTTPCRIPLTTDPSIDTDT